MKDKLDIFVLGYKAFDCKVTNPIYKIIDGGEESFEAPIQILNDTVGDSISELNGFYSELTRMYWVWKNLPLKKYVGFCHYRRYFEFFDDIPDMDEIFKDHDIVLPKPYKCGTVILKQYSKAHNNDDYKTMLAIIKTLRPDYYEGALKLSLTTKHLYINNSFIMKREDFLCYCDFIFPILEAFLTFHGFKTTSDIEKYVSDHADTYLNHRTKPNSEVWYQSRIGGFLAERLFTIWLSHHYVPERVKHIPLIMTEKKYNKIS